MVRSFLCIVPVKSARLFVFHAILLIIFFACVSCVYAQTTLYLTSGVTVEGDLIEQTGEYIRLDVYGVTVTYWLDEVERAVFDDGTELIPQDAAMPLYEEEAPLYEETASHEEIQADVVSIPQVPPPQEPQDEPFSVSSQVPSPFSQRQPADTASGIFAPLENDAFSPQETARAQDMVKLMAVIWQVVFIVGVLSFLFIAFCLMQIAGKTGTANGWFAWVPVLNFILMCDIAGKPRWWAALFLVAFIPFLGQLAVFIVSLLLNVGIARKRGKPGWVGVLATLPLVGIFTYGYLAFAE